MIYRFVHLVLYQNAIERGDKMEPLDNGQKKFAEYHLRSFKRTERSLMKFNLAELRVLIFYEAETRRRLRVVDRLIARYHRVSRENMTTRIIRHINESEAKPPIELVEEPSL